MKNIYLDCETTGLTPGNICQLTTITEDSGKIVEAKNYFFTVNYITDGAAQLLNRDVEFYRKASNGLAFNSYADEIFEKLNNNIVIGHNVKFDINFLSTELWRQNKVLKLAGSADTMLETKDLIKIPAKNKKYGIYKNPKLTEMAEYFNIEDSQIIKLIDKLFEKDSSENSYHDSRYDTTVTFVCLNILREIRSGKAGYWSETFRTPGTFDVTGRKIETITL